jgi:ABC-type transport system involved in multi-copper enzyme maturation permease subunit
MMWLTWRQFRVQATAAVAILAGFAVILGITGSHLTHLYATSGMATCQLHGTCSALYAGFIGAVKADSIYPFLYFFGTAVLVITPALIGAFWGAPLVTRELEAGTFRLAWNQGVTRTRWLAIKLTAVGMAAMITTGLLSLMITWWVSPIDRAGGFPNNMGRFSRFSPLIFAARGITPIGYAAFAFVLGVTVGVLIRRTLPAMAVTIAVFTAIAIVMPSWVRPHLLPPDHATTAISAATLADNGFVMTSNGELTVPVNISGAWITSNQAITTAGHVFVLPIVPACQTGTQRQCTNWIADQHLRQVISYQPASRFWALQWYETAIFLALALLLVGLCCWRIRRLIT